MNRPPPSPGQGGVFNFNQGGGYFNSSCNWNKPFGGYRPPNTSAGFGGSPGNYVPPGGIFQNQNQNGMNNTNPMLNQSIFTNGLGAQNVANMLDNVKDIFKQNPSKNMIHGVMWEEVNENGDDMSTTDTNDTVNEDMNDFVQNFSTIADRKDIHVQEMGHDELQFQNQAFGEESNDIIEKIGMKMLVTKEYNIVVEKDPLEVGDERFEEEDNPNFDLSNMGDQRQWNNWVINTFNPKQGLDMSQIGMAFKTTGDYKEVEVGSYGNTLNPYLNPHTYDISKSVSFIAESSKYEGIRMQYERSGGHYRDPKFPASYSSIAGFGDLHGYPEHYLRDITWKRPNEVFGGRHYQIFEKTIDPNDIKQGILGDCYLLAAMAAVAEHQDRIKKLFLSREVTSTGVYCVALCINGLWEEIILDDYIPCKPGGNGHQIAFNHTSNNELWAILLEKAWAKVHGGYMNIDGGLIREALRDLTGAPCKSYFSRLDSPDVHWKRILEGEDNEWIMCAGSGDLAGTGNDARDKRTGLSGNHAYSLLAAYELENQGGGRYRLVSHKEKGSSRNERIVKMRNPWGKGEWTGSWSDNDHSKWTPQMKQLLNHSGEDDGIFFMPYKDFLKYFHDYQICFYEDEYKYSAKRYNSSSQRPTIIEFQVKKKGDYYFCINQINRRFFKRSDSKFNFIPNLSKNILTLQSLSWLREEKEMNSSTQV